MGYKRKKGDEVEAQQSYNLKIIHLCELFEPQINLLHIGSFVVMFMSRHWVKRDSNTQLPLLG